MAKFDEHFVPKWNIINERAHFYQRIQNQGETVESFVQSFYELTERCHSRDQQIREIHSLLLLPITQPQSQQLERHHESLT